MSNMEGKEPENRNEDSVPLWPSGLSPLGSLGFGYPAVTTSLSQSSKKRCFFHFLRLHGGGGGGGGEERGRGDVNFSCPSGLPSDSVELATPFPCHLHILRSFFCLQPPLIPVYLLPLAGDCSKAPLV